MKFYNETLNPKFYVKDKMIPALRKKLIDITKDFLERVELNFLRIKEIFDGSS